MRGIERVGRGRLRLDLRASLQVTGRLAEVEAKIADLSVIAATLQAVLDAGCADLIECAGLPYCPLPFAGLVGQAGEVAGDAAPC